MHHLTQVKTRNRIQYTRRTTNSTEGNSRILVIVDLGIPIGYHVNQTPELTMTSLLEKVKKLHESLLAPWQKIEALNMFLLSKLDFIMKGAKVAMKPLHKADNKIKAYVKKWLSAITG